jgi:transcriptional regulator with XRE-family HTH domain
MTTASLRPAGRVPQWELYDRLGKAQRDAGIGVAEMADLLGVSRETVGRWLSGRGVPKRGALVAWASLTGVDLRWLETGEVQAAPDNDPTPPAQRLPRLDSNQQPSGYLFPHVRAA